MMIDRNDAIEIAKIAMVMKAESEDGPAQTMPNIGLYIGGVRVCVSGGLGLLDARLAVADVLFQKGFRHHMGGGEALHRLHAAPA